MLGFSSRASWRNCCTARCWSIWYRFFIATLSFFLAEKPPSAHYDRGCESRYFLRINGHPHIHIYGNTAVLTTLEKTSAQIGGHPISGQARNTYVCVKRGGRWNVVLRQITPVLQPNK